MNSNLPIARSTISEMCTTWRIAEKNIREAFQTLSETERALKDVFCHGDSTYLFSMVRSGYDFNDYSKPEKVIAELKKDAWRMLVARTEIRRILSIQRANELDKQLETGAGLPEIEEESILRMLDNILSSASNFIEEAVREVFEYLRPSSYKRWGKPEYKTNEKVRWQCGRKVIKEWVVEGRYDRAGFHVGSHSQDRLRAVDNVFHALDGKGSVKTTRGPLVDAIEAANGSGVGETEYFKFKCFKNRNLHLEFKRMDLVDKLNLIAGGGQLKDVKEEQ